MTRLLKSVVKLMETVEFHGTPNYERFIKLLLQFEAERNGLQVTKVVSK